jgi:hypothetical protein
MKQGKALVSNELDTVCLTNSFCCNLANISTLLEAISDDNLDVSLCDSNWYEKN